MRYNAEAICFHKQLMQKMLTAVVKADRVMTHDMQSFPYQQHMEAVLKFAAI